jgi:hypothetical protein
LVALAVPLLPLFETIRKILVGRLSAGRFLALVPFNPRSHQRHDLIGTRPKPIRDKYVTSSNEFGELVPERKTFRIWSDVERSKSMAYRAFGVRLNHLDILDIGPLVKALSRKKSRCQTCGFKMDVIEIGENPIGKRSYADNGSECNVNGEFP